MALFKIFGKKKKARNIKKPVKHIVKKRVKVVKATKHKAVKKKVAVKVSKPAKVIKKPVKVVKEPQIKPLINKMSDEDAFEILKRYRIKVPDYAFCKNEEQLKQALKKTSFPCVLKASGKNIIHKTDVNGIRLDIKTEEEAVKNFNELMKIRGCEKVLAQKMITEGYEIIVGGRKDPQFNRVIALGAGGVFTEFLRDVSFRIAPVSREDAEEMLMEVRFSELLLKGFRGQKPADKESIINTILSLSRIMESNPKISEVDINPLFATSKDAIAADVRIILE
jgi:acetyl-CoA synthetase (ADP-forming)